MRSLAFLGLAFFVCVFVQDINGAHTGESIESIEEINPAIVVDPDVKEIDQLVPEEMLVEVPPMAASSNNQEQAAHKVAPLSPIRVILTYTMPDRRAEPVPLRRTSCFRCCTRVVASGTWSTATGIRASSSPRRPRRRPRSSLNKSWRRSPSWHRRPR